MTTWTPHHKRQTPASRLSRKRKSLAATLEIALEPRHAARRGLLTWPRIPQVNRVAVSEPLREVASLLRDPAVTVPESALPRIMAFASHPASPAFGPHPVRAKFAAYALVDEVRAAVA